MTTPSVKKYLLALSFYCEHSVLSMLNISFSSEGVVSTLFGHFFQFISVIYDNTCKMHARFHRRGADKRDRQNNKLPHLGKTQCYDYFNTNANFQVNSGCLLVC